MKEGSYLSCFEVIDEWIGLRCVFGSFEAKVDGENHRIITGVYRLKKCLQDGCDTFVADRVGFEIRGELELRVKSCFFAGSKFIRHILNTYTLISIVYGCQSSDHGSWGVRSRKKC